MAVAPWIVSDELWELVEPLLPKVERRFRYPGRKRLPDRRALQGILFVLHTGIAWRHLPLELGFGGGSTCYRRLTVSFSNAVCGTVRLRLVFIKPPVPWHAEVLSRLNRTRRAWGAVVLKRPIGTSQPRPASLPA